MSNRIIDEMIRYRSFRKGERSTYVRLRVSDGLGVGNGRNGRILRRAHSLLFVCFGNIIRSPMCEALMKRAVAGHPHAHVTVTSAGLHATAGKAAHPWAITAAQELGLSLKEHGARELTSEMMDQADAVFAMDYQNRVELLSRYPQAKSKILMLGAYGGNECSSLEIRDPYNGDQQEVRRCYQLLQVCVTKIACTMLQLSQHDATPYQMKTTADAGAERDCC